MTISPWAAFGAAVLVTGSASLWTAHNILLSREYPITTISGELFVDDVSPEEVELTSSPLPAEGPYRASCRLTDSAASVEIVGDDKSGGFSRIDTMAGIAESSAGSLKAAAQALQACQHYIRYQPGQQTLVLSFGRVGGPLAEETFTLSDPAQRENAVARVTGWQNSLKG